jgi:hypothetical protein
MAVSMKFRFVFWDVVKTTSKLTRLSQGPLIALMMEAARTSETLVDNYFTWQYIPEDKSELQDALFPPLPESVLLEFDWHLMTYTFSPFQ